MLLGGMTICMVYRGTALFKGREWAKVSLQVSFVRNDVWDKYKSKCSPANFVVPAAYVLEDCHLGQHCKGPYRSQ
jgi:hypothetical protein